MTEAQVVKGVQSHFSLFESSLNLPQKVGYYGKEPLNHINLILNRNFFATKRHAYF